MGLLSSILLDQYKQSQASSRAEEAKGLLGTSPTQQEIMPMGDRMSVQIGTKSPGEGYLGSQKGFEDRAKLMTGMLGAGYSSADAKSVLDQATAPAAPAATTQQRNFADYIGMDDAQRSLYEQFRKSGAASINMITPPTGYTLVDPNDPSKGAVAIPGGPASKASAAEAKQLAQGEIASQMVSDITAGVNAGQDISSIRSWAEFELGNNPLTSWMTALTPESANMGSNIVQLENLTLAMIRGAQVGPKEQKMFAKQLPQLGQDPALFSANLENTKRNIEQMTKTIKRLRNISDPATGAPPPIPPGFMAIP